MPNFDEMWGEVQEEIQEKDAENAVVNRAPELRTLSENIDKATNTWSMPLYNWSLPSSSIREPKGNWTLPLQTSVARLTLSMSILTMFWKMLRPNFRSQSMSLMLTGRRYKTCLTRNTNGCLQRCKNISMRSMVCLSKNAGGLRNDTRNMMAVIWDIMPSISLGSSSYWDSYCSFTAWS